MPDPRRRAVQFRVTGRVQGVSYRYFAWQAAQRLGLGGWVRNCQDGSVEGGASGTPEALTDFRRELEKGPTFARVEAYTEEELAVDPGWRDFEIRH